MDRTRLRVDFQGDPEEAQRKAEAVLSARGYAIHDYRAVSVWKKPAPMTSALQFLQLECADGHLDLSTWLQAGVTHTESGWEVLPNAFTAAVLKRSLDQTVKLIRHALEH